MTALPLPFTIRRCTPADAPLVAGVGARLFAQAYGPTHPEPELGRYLARSFGVETVRAALASPAVRVLVAEAAGAVIAYAWLRVPGTPAPDGVAGVRPAEIVRFYVDAGWHGGGVAAALMAACVDEARRDAADVIWLDVWQEAARPIAFYRRMGFAVVGRAHFVFGDRVDDDHVMARELDGAGGGRRTREEGTG